MERGERQIKTKMRQTDQETDKKTEKEKAISFQLKEIQKNRK